MSTGTATVKSSNGLNVRSGRGTNYPKLGALTNGTKVTYYGDSGGWLEIKYNGKTGYISKEYTAISNASSSGAGSSTGAPADNSASGTVHVTADTLRLREQPNTNCTILTTLPKNTTVSYTAESNGWLKVTYNGKTGWISKQYTAPGKGTTSGGNTSGGSTGGSTPAPTENSTSGTVHVTADALRLREQPNTNCGILTTLSKNTTVTYTAESNGWLKVTYGGKTGWISKQYTAPGKGTSAPVGGGDSSGGGSSTGGNMTNQYSYGMPLSKYHLNLGYRNNEVSRLHPKLQAKVAQLNDGIAKAGLPFKLFEGMRSPERQEQCKRDGSSKLGAWYGRHNYGLAVDYVGYVGGWTWDNKLAWSKLGEIGRNLGLTWGGDWKDFTDRPHFELKTAPSTDTCKALYAKGGIDAVWNKV